jgi:putative redox protein
MTSQIIYKGDLRTEAVHQQSGSAIETDAPTDNEGRGERFSPTDLLATSLGSCQLTIMGIKARDLGIDLSGTTADITKHMAANPRRVSQIDVVITFPAGRITDEKQQAILQHAAHACPVSKSLHPDIVQNVTFRF